MRVKFGEMWQSRQAAAYKDNPVTTLSDNTKTSGRRYRNRPDVFVVADDDDNEDTETSTTSSTLVNISLYSTSPEIAYSFPCSEVTSSNDTILRLKCSDRSCTNSYYMYVCISTVVYYMYV